VEVYVNFAIGSAVI